MFKIPLSFHYTGWFTGIPLLDCYNPQYMKGSLIPFNPLSSTNRGFEHCSVYDMGYFLNINGNLWLLLLWRLVPLLWAHKNTWMI